MSEELIHKVVDEVSFGLISPKNLRKQSVVEIQTPDRAILRFAKKHIPTLKLNRHLDKSSGGEIYGLWKEERKA